MHMPNPALAAELITIYDASGRERYGLETISQLEHALQTAARAEAEGESPAMILAALLHDLGHMIAGIGDNPAEGGIDNAHQRVGARWLRERLGARIAEPVRLHVDAKRYLCAVDPAYHATLAPDSVLSLKLQGGPLNDTQVTAFLAEPYAQDAIRLRRFDDLAKDPDAKTEDFAYFLRYLRDAAIPG
jgi:phosphonate degradation associated HDIG domain protein